MENTRKVSPKFKTIFLGKIAPKDARLKMLKYWCGQFHCHGLVPCYGGGSYGNLSFRVKKGADEFIITASGLKLKRGLTDRSFFHVTKVDTNRKKVEGYGLRLPSSESLLHFAIYQKRKDINAIFHGHCMRLLKAPCKYRIPQTSKEAPYGTIALVRRVFRILGKHQFIVMKNHGFISMGKNMNRAGKLTLATKRMRSNEPDCK